MKKLSELDTDTVPDELGEGYADVIKVKYLKAWAREHIKELRRELLSLQSDIELKISMYSKDDFNDKVIINNGIIDYLKEMFEIKESDL